VRVRRAWFGIAETLSFFAAASAAVGRFLIGRWSEPPGQDYLMSKDPNAPFAPGSGQGTGPRLTSRKVRHPRRGTGVRVSRGGASIEIQSK
jgi:hypothetical protein